MTQYHCSHCRRRRDVCDLNLRKVKKYKTISGLYFCKDNDCYIKYMQARQSYAQIKKVIHNKTAFSR